MSHSTLPWHQDPAARDLLAGLRRHDVRLSLARGCPGPDRLVWYPDSDHGAFTFEALGALRRTAVGPAFAKAPDDRARAAALASAQRAPTVEASIAARFGDPSRWLGHSPTEATRRFHANGI